MHKESALLLPRDKHDIEHAAALVALEWKEVEYVVPRILERLQDLNWPVAGVFGPFLVDAGARLAPFIRPIFAAHDAIWTFNLLQTVVSRSPALATELSCERERMANNPTLAECAEGVSAQAWQILADRTL